MTFVVVQDNFVFLNLLGEIRYRSRLFGLRRSPERRRRQES
jgi:hypothetical protein